MTTKDYALSIEARNSHLFVRATGTRTRQSVFEITTEVFRATLANRLSKVLVDVKALEGRLAVMDIYVLVTGPFEDLRGKGITQAAIVDRPQSSMREWFLETVAYNRGFHVRVFTDAEEALHWLLGNTDT